MTPTIPEPACLTYTPQMLIVPGAAVMVLTMCRARYTLSAPIATALTAMVTVLAANNLFLFVRTDALGLGNLGFLLSGRKSNRHSQQAGEELHQFVKQRHVVR